MALAAVAEVLLSGGTALVIDVDHKICLAIVHRLIQFGVPQGVLTDQARFRHTDAEDKALLLGWWPTRGLGSPTSPWWIPWAR